VRPPDVGAVCLLQPGVSASRPGEGRAYTNVGTALLLGLVNIVVQQRLLPAACCQLLRVQATIKVKRVRRSTSQPLPLLPDCQRILLRTTSSNQAGTPAQPHTIVVTVITRISLVSDPARRLATSSFSTEQLHALLRSDTGSQEAIQSVLVDTLVTRSFSTRVTPKIESGPRPNGYEQRRCHFPLLPLAFPWRLPTRPGVAHGVYCCISQEPLALRLHMYNLLCLPCSCWLVVYD
jgi:hypothetical protein